METSKWTFWCHAVRDFFLGDYMTCAWLAFRGNSCGPASTNALHRHISDLFGGSEVKGLPNGPWARACSSSKGQLLVVEIGG